MGIRNMGIRNAGIGKKRVDGLKNGRSVDGCVYGFRKCI